MPSLKWESFFTPIRLKFDKVEAWAWTEKSPDEQHKMEHFKSFFSIVVKLEISAISLVFTLSNYSY